MGRHIAASDLLVWEFAMSNAQYRTAEKSSRFSALLAREKLVREAVEKLYLKKGGSLLDLDIKLCEATVDDALICRQSDNRRLTENPDAQREPGEKPMVTVSEGRLHARELVRYSEKREELRLAAKNSIEEAINRLRPANDDELRDVLEAAAEDTSGVGRMAMFTPREAQEEPIPMEALATAAGGIGGKLTDADERAMLSALKQFDRDAVFALVDKQSGAIQQEFNQRLNALLSK